MTTTLLANREVYDGRDTLAPHLTMIGWASYTSAMDSALAPHRHHNAFELCCLIRGGVRWWVGDETYELGAGQLFVTRPGEPHGGINDVLHPCELYWLQLSPPGKTPIAGLSKADSLTLTRRLNRLSSRSFPGGAEVESAYARLIAAHRVGGVYGRAAARAAMLDVLVGVLRRHDDHAAQGVDRKPASLAIQRAMRWTLDHLDEDHGLEAIAHTAGLSVTRLHERFKAETGFTPADWRTRQRIAQAKAMLREPGRSITEVAMACGFSTSQYFATTFKRLEGVTPGKWRRASQPMKRNSHGQARSRS